MGLDRSSPPAPRWRRWSVSRARSSAVPMGVVIAGCVLLSLGVWRRWEAGK